MKRKLCCIFLLLSVFLFATGCAPSKNSNDKMQRPPRYEEMVQLIGLQKEHVLEKLQIQQADLQIKNDGAYATPITVSFNGVTMTIELAFGPLDDRLNGFYYKAYYQNESEVAAKNMHLVANGMRACFGNPDAGNSSYAWDMTEEEIIKSIDAGEFQNAHSWYMANDSTDQIEEYIQALSETELYAGYAKLKMKPGLKCELVLSAYANTPTEPVTAYLTVSCHISPVPSK